MFRITILSLLLAVAATTMVSGDESTVAPTYAAEVCGEILEDFTICLFSVDANSNFDGDDSMVDDVACTKCYTDNGLYQDNLFGELSCTEAMSEVCSFFDECTDVCFPKHTVCVEEASSYYSCVFGSVIAPPDCVVKCDGSFLDGNESPASSDGSDPNGGESNSQNDDKDKDSTSGTSATPMITLSGMASIALVIAGLSL